MRRLATSRLVIAALSSIAAGCAAAQPEVVMLPKPPSAGPVVQGPGAPRVHVELPAGNSLEGIELRELAGWKLTPYSHQSAGVTATGARSEAIGRPVCAPPCGLVIDGRGGQEFYFAGPGIRKSDHF